MTFLRTNGGDLVALFDIKRIYDVDHADGSHSTMAVMRADDATVELARDYSIPVLARVLDPVRNGSSR